MLIADVFHTMNTRSYFVYILRSINYPEKIYVGYTNDLNRRVYEHNTFSQLYSKRYAPWQLETYIVFKSKEKALFFEHYLKTHSGMAVLKKRLL